MIEILSPIQKQVFQRDKKGQSVLIVSGRFVSGITKNLVAIEPVKISIVRISTGEIVVNVPAENVNSVIAGGVDWNATVTLNSGFYELTASTKTDSKAVRFGVGLTFACTGHSFAEGIGSAFVTDERAIIQSNIDGAGVNPIDFVSTPIYKSIRDYSISDSSRTQGFWGILAEKLVKEFNCPVLIYHAPWGGTSIKHWSIAASGGIAKQYAGYNPNNDGKGYPYAKLKNIVQKLVPKTGLHSVLIIHGNNDTKDTRENIEQYYKDVIAATRRDANIPTLPFNLALSTWHPATETQVTTAQLNVIRDVPNVYLGADINKIGADGRLRPTGLPQDQDLHLNNSGNLQAAELWAKALIPLCKVDNVNLTPIVVLGGTNQVIQPKLKIIDNLKELENPFTHGLGIIFILLLLRFVGLKIPIWALVLFGVSTGVGFYYNQNLTKKA